MVLPSPGVLDVAVTEVRAAHAARTRLPRWVRSGLFWAKRYLPPEIAGTATMLAAGLAASAAGLPPVLVGIAASEGEGVGFYAVAGVSVWREQRRNFPDRGRLRILLRVLGLLLFEFGPAELLDTFLLRPLALTLAVQFIPAVAWALIAGKVVADIVFYVLAATAFRVSERAGIRGDASAGAQKPT
jgi:hypothetical protein